MTPRAVLVGPPGSGKSTVGPLLAKLLGVSFRDVDEDIVALAGKPISEIFAEDGEPAFRELEQRCVATALEEHPGVLSLGGGAVLAERTRELLGAHRVAFLNVGMAAGVQRCGLSTARPLLAGVNPRATYKSLLDARLPLYRSVATVVVDTDRSRPDELAALIAGQLGEHLPQTSTVD